MKPNDPVALVARKIWNYTRPHSSKAISVELIERFIRDVIADQVAERKESESWRGKSNDPAVVAAQSWYSVVKDSHDKHSWCFDHPKAVKAIRAAYADQTAELERYRKERDDANEAEMILAELNDDEAAEAGGEG